LLNTRCKYKIVRTILPFPLVWGGRVDALFTPRCIYKWAESDNAHY